MGKTFEEYTESGYIVGDEDSDLSHLDLAEAQNEEGNGDTSCAIFDEDDEVGAEEEGQVVDPKADVAMV